MEENWIFISNFTNIAKTGIFSLVIEFFPRIFCPSVIFQNVLLISLEFKASYAFIFVQKSYNHVQPILRAKKRDKGIKKQIRSNFFVHRWNYLDKITAGEEDNISSPLHLKLLHTCTTSPLLLFRIQYATLLFLIKNNSNIWYSQSNASELEVSTILRYLT